MTTRDRMILMVVVGAGLLAGFWFAVLGPKRAEATRLSEQLAAQQQRLDKARTGAADVQRAKDGYIADYAAVVNLGKAVPVNANVASLLFQLDSESRGAKVDFNSISAGTGAGKGTAGAAAASGAASPAAGALPGGVTPAPFNFTFTGSYFDLQKLLDRINGFVAVSNGGVQVSGRLLTINDIALSSSSNDFSKIQANISASAYQAPAAQAAGTTAAGAASAGTTAGGTATPAASTATASSTPASGTATASTGTTTSGSGSPTPSATAMGTIR